MFTYDEYRESADFIRTKLNGFTPEVLLILGSGLGFLGDAVEAPIHVPYGEIPHFRVSTAPDHVGRFVFGQLGGRNVAVMQGRLHVYEGYTPQEVTYPIRVARLLGIDSMVITNACGGVNENYHVGELVFLKDMINTTAVNPLIGPNIEEFGPRFCDMSYTFDREYRKIAAAAAAEVGIKTHEGVYYYATGPQFETPAEIRGFRTLGADVVGMSTVPECVVANHAGIRILGISVVTNMAAGILDRPMVAGEVNESAERVKKPFSEVIVRFLERMRG